MCAIKLMSGDKRNSEIILQENCNFLNECISEAKVISFKEMKGFVRKSERVKENCLRHPKTQT